MARLNCLSSQAPSIKLIDVKRIGLYLPLIIICCWLGQSCKQDSAIVNNPEKPVHSVVLTLTKQSYVISDTIKISLSEPLQSIGVVFDEKNIEPYLPDIFTIAIPTDILKVGAYRVVISGQDLGGKMIIDTFSVEIRSDITPRHIQYEVMAIYPHDTSSFTQGLELYRGLLYEGTGLHGQSKIKLIEPTTGHILKQSKTLPSEHFGEGITIVNDKIYQLTWKSGRCFRYDMELKVDRTFEYDGQGWGLTHSDSTLIISDGSNGLVLYTLDFKPLRRISVYDDKGGVWKINELEYVDGFVFANVWETNRVIQIDLESGKVVGELNLRNLVPINLSNPRLDVANGIAYNQNEDVFYVTGKNWPVLYKISIK